MQKNNSSSLYRRTRILCVWLLLQPKRTHHNKKTPKLHTSHDVARVGTYLFIFFYNFIIQAVRNHGDAIGEVQHCPQEEDQVQEVTI